MSDEQKKFDSEASQHSEPEEELAHDEGPHEDNVPSDAQDAPTPPNSDDEKAMINEGADVDLINVPEELQSDHTDASTPNIPAVAPVKQRSLAATKEKKLPKEKKVKKQKKVKKIKPLEFHEEGVVVPEYAPAVTGMLCPKFALEKPLQNPSAMMSIKLVKWKRN